MLASVDVSKLPVFSSLCTLSRPAAVAGGGHKAHVPNTLHSPQQCWPAFDVTCCGQAWRGTPSDPPQGPQPIPIRPTPAVSGGPVQAPPAPAPEQAADTLQPPTAASPQQAPLPADQPQDPQQPADPSQGHADGPGQHPKQPAASPRQTAQMQELGDSQASDPAQQAGQVLQGLNESAGRAGDSAQAVHDDTPTGPQGQIDAGPLLALLPSGASQAQRLLMLCHLLLQVSPECL